MTSSNPLDVITLRKRLGLTQGELARCLTVSPRTIRRWEQGAPMHLVWQERLSAMWIERFPREDTPLLAKGAGA